MCPLLLLVGLALVTLPTAGQSLGFERDRAKAILNDVSRMIENHFYDPNLKRLDWKRLVAETRQRIEQAPAPAQMYAEIFALVEKLGDSHTVFIPPALNERSDFG